MVFHGFFKELDFKELEIHRYSLLDIHQWIFIDGYPSMNSLMDKFIDGYHWWIFIDGYPYQWIWSLPLVPFLWAPFFGPFPLGPMGPPLGPMGPGPLVNSNGIPLDQPARSPRKQKNGPYGNWGGFDKTERCGKMVRDFVGPVLAIFCHRKLPNL